MCRNIKKLFNFEPSATEKEIKEASLQFVRKISGFYEPSSANKQVFDSSINEIAIVSKKLIDSLVTNAHHHTREIEAQKARMRARQRFGA